MQHRIRWESGNYGVNKPGAYVICCSCGKWLEGKTRSDALTLMHEHKSADDPRRGVPARMRLVTQLPLQELWNDRGLIEAERLRDLDADGIRQQLREGAVAVIANIGARLEWIEGEKLFEWWKSEATPRLFGEAAELLLDDMPEGRAWRASLWSRGWDRHIVLFEAYH